jgi:transcriptional regulator with XRE-family HTH domain
MPETTRRTEPAPTPQSGGRIRALRRTAGLTLPQLADQAGISVGFLSQVERDKATPSPGTLASLAGALEVDRFIATPRPADPVTRAGERPTFGLADSSLRCERPDTTLPGGTLSSLIIHVPFGYRSEITAHAGEEPILVLDGTIRQTPGEAAMVLHPPATACTSWATRPMPSPTSARCRPASCGRASRRG